MFQSSQHHRAKELLAWTGGPKDRDCVISESSTAVFSLWTSWTHPSMPCKASTKGRNPRIWQTVMSLPSSKWEKLCVQHTYVPIPLPHHFLKNFYASQPCRELDRHTDDSFQQSRWAKDGPELGALGLPSYRKCVNWHFQNEALAGSRV